MAKSNLWKEEFILAHGSQGEESSRESIAALSPSEQERWGASPTGAD